MNFQISFFNLILIMQISDSLDEFKDPSRLTTPAPVNPNHDQIGTTSNQRHVKHSRVLRCFVHYNNVSTLEFTFDATKCDLTRFVDDMLHQVTNKFKVQHLWQPKTTTIYQSLINGNNNEHQNRIQHYSKQQLMDTLVQAYKNQDGIVHFVIEDLSYFSHGAAIDCTIDLSALKMDNIEIALRVCSELADSSNLWMESWVELEYQITSLLQSGSGRWHDKYSIYDTNSKLIKKLKDFIGSVKGNGQDQPRIMFVLKVCLWFVC